MRPPVLLLLLLSAVPAFSADSWTLPLFTTSPADVYDAAQKFAAPSDADIFLVDAEVTFSIDDAGRLSEKRRAVYRILTDPGAKQFGKFTEAWMAWRQSKPVLRARVITPDKLPHELDPATVTEAGLPGVNEMYGDVKILQAPLPAIGSGCVIEVQVETLDRESVMSGARFERYPAAMPYPAHHLVVQIESPKPLLAEARGFDKIERKVNGPGSIRFEAWDMKKHEQQPLLPPDAPAGPEILLTTAPSWRSVARWYFDLTEPLLAKANAQPVAEADREKTIESILADLQKNVRYTGLELGMGAYQPRAPVETLTRGYGDCKDKATVLISRLRAAGISAQYALITPFPFEDALPGMPGMETFNHVIVYLPGSHPQWIDPTSQFTPATRLPLGDQGRNALIVDPQTTALTRTPESTAPENHLLSETIIRLQPQKKANFSVTETYSGGSEEVMRNMFSTMLASPSAKERLQSEISRVLRAEKITAVDADIPSGFDKPFEVRLSGEGLAQAMTTGQVATAEIPLDMSVFGGLRQLSVAEKSEEKEEKKDDKKDKPPRTEDYFLVAAMSSEIRHVIVPPPGFAVKQLPEVRNADVGGAKLERTASVRPDNSVVIVDRYTMPKNRFTVAEAETIASEMTKVESGSGLRIEFVDRIQQLRSDGKDKEALAVARERVSASPKSVEALIGLASTLSSLGANLEAIDTCLRATVVDPKSSEAFAQLGDLYSRDEAGRLHRSGFQREKAIQAYQRAIELAPGDGQLKVKLSAIYTLNDRGVFGGKGANLKEAIAALRELDKASEKQDNPNALPTALVVDRQYGEVKALYANGELKGSISFRLAAIAASENAEAAIAVFNGSGTREDRDKVFRHAVQLLLQNQEYGAAAGMLREALKDDNGGQADADLLAQTHPRAEAKFSAEPPVALAQRLIYALLDEDDLTSWKKLYATDSQYLTLRPERLQIWHALAAYHQVAKFPLGSAGVADVAVSNAVFVSEGAPETGFRVRVADPSNNGAMKTIAWVAKRGGDYRVLGAGGDWAVPGLEALAAVNRNDLKAARQWLDWMREELPQPSAIDPLAVFAFTKLWTPGNPPENQGINEARAAAASLAIRGKNYEDALAALRDAQTRFPSGPFRDAIDLAITQGLFMHQKFAGAVPEAKNLLSHFPDSDTALSSAALSETYAGQDAAPLLAERLAKDANSAPALRVEASVFEAQNHYDQAVATLVKLSHTSKVTAQDWNTLAWTSLFTGETGPAALEAANNAARLTQGRNVNLVHTLGCVKAATGDTAGARKALFQYLDSTGEWDDAAQVLLGMIQEQLGLTASARHTYEEIRKAEFETPTSSFALARKQLAHLDLPATSH